MNLGPGHHEKVLAKTRSIAGWHRPREADSNLMTWMGLPGDLSTAAQQKQNGMWLRSATGRPIVGVGASRALTASAPKSPGAALTAETSTDLRLRIKGRQNGRRESWMQSPGQSPDWPGEDLYLVTRKYPQRQS